MCPQKVLALAYHALDDAVWRPRDPHGRLRNRALHLHNLLNGRPEPVHIHGISVFYHDSAAALIDDGKAIAAAQEGHFTHKKQDSSFPVNSMEYCLREADIELSDVDFIAFYDKAFLKFERLMETSVAYAPRGFESFRKAMPLWLK